uniref:Serine palmitoyltransferase small subunit B n=1 Tax=Laticauda laticaudata TaxID=8630 RepID=A0A8C5RG51_LATLA
MDYRKIKNYFYWLYFQYLMVTCGNDFEHWEQIVIHIVATTTFTMLAYTAYVFIPIHLHLAYQFFLQFLIKYWCGYCNSKLYNNSAD